MNLLSLKNSSNIGKIGGNLIVFGLLAAGIFGLLFIVNLCFQNLSSKINPEIWGQFGDFLGGTWGVLLTAGSALLIVETLGQQQKQIENQENQIQKQEEHEQIRSFENQLFKLLDFFNHIYSIEFRRDLVKKVDNYRSLIKSNRNNIDSHKIFINFYYYMVFGEDHGYTKDQVSHGLVRIKNNLPFIDGKEQENATERLNNGVQMQNIDSNLIPIASYFRLLFGIYSFINNPKHSFLNHQNRFQYSMLISNLLTTEDQVMIFSNSLTDLGKSWESYGNESKNDDKRIITKYAIIRNIPTHYLDPIELRIHFPDIKFEWMDKTPESRKILKFS